MSVVLAGRYPFPRRPSGYKREKAVSCTCVHNTATVTVSEGCPSRATRTPYYRCPISQLQNNFPGKINKITPDPAITGFPQLFATTASSISSQSRHERFEFNKYKIIQFNSAAPGWLIDVATYPLGGKSPKALGEAADPGPEEPIEVGRGVGRLGPVPGAGQGPVARLPHDRRPFRATCPRRIGPRDRFEGRDTRLPRRDRLKHGHGLPQGYRGVRARAARSAGGRWHRGCEAGPGSTRGSGPAPRSRPAAGGEVNRR
jgi:hypothetical protein